MAAPLLLSDSSTDLGSDQLRQSTSWRTPPTDCALQEEFGKLSSGPRTLRPRCLTADFRFLEVNVSKDPTSAGERKSGRGAGTSAFGRPNCPVRRGLRGEGVRGIQTNTTHQRLQSWFLLIVVYGDDSVSLITSGLSLMTCEASKMRWSKHRCAICCF